LVGAVVADVTVRVKKDPPPRAHVEVVTESPSYARSSDVQSLQNQINSLRNELNSLRSDLSSVSNENRSLRNQVNQQSARISELENSRQTVIVKKRDDDDDGHNHDREPTRRIIIEAK
jgi:TolA-binding protein